MLAEIHLILGILGSAILGCLIAAIQSSKPPKALAVLVFGTGAFVFSGIFGFYLGLERKEAARTSSGNAITLNTPSSESKPSPAPQRVAPATPANTPTQRDIPPPISDAEQAKSDVFDSIDSWKSMAEEHNFNSHMDSYADRVDYFLKKNASRDFVRKDRSKAFLLYKSMRIDITNMRIALADEGEKATAIFDKSWEFSGPKNYVIGKVNQQLQLERINGQWRITGEKDLKLYYKKVN